MLTSSELLRLVIEEKNVVAPYMPCLTVRVIKNGVPGLREELRAKAGAARWGHHAAARRRYPGIHGHRWRLAVAGSAGRFE
jgi:hypothetical protein